MPPGTRTDEAGGNHLAPVEPPLFVERLAMNEPAGPLAISSSSLVLHYEPLGEPPSADTLSRFAWVVRIGRRCVEPLHGDSRHDLEFANEPGLHDLLKVTRLRPGVETTDDRRIPWQVNECAGPVSRNDLAATDLTVGLPGHVDSTSEPARSLRNRFTSGSTSRSDRLARNFRWCSDSKSLSSISRRSGRGCFSSYFWYCTSTPAAR